MKRLRRWLRRRGFRVGPLVRALAIYALLILVLAAPAVAYYQEPGINGVASRLAGKKVTVECATPDDQANDANFAIYGVEGYVEGWVDPTGRWHPYPVAYFKDVHCQNLVAALAGDLSGIDIHDLAWSLLVVVHESGHLRGAKWSGDEAKTECWAMQHARAALNMLGFRELIQWKLILAQLLHIHNFELDTAYQEPGCRLPTL